MNTRLKKDIFDCNKIGDFYDCGCGDHDGPNESHASRIEDEMKKSLESGEEPNQDPATPVEINDEPYVPFSFF